MYKYQKLAAMHRRELYQEAEKQRVLRLVKPSLRNALAHRLYRVAQWLEPETQGERVLNVR